MPSSLLVRSLASRASSRILGQVFLARLSKLAISLSSLERAWTCSGSKIFFLIRIRRRYRVLVSRSVVAPDSKPHSYRWPVSQARCQQDYTAAHASVSQIDQDNRGKDQHRPSAYLGAVLIHAAAIADVERRQNLARPEKAALRRVKDPPPLLEAKVAGFHAIANLGAEDKGHRREEELAHVDIPVCVQARAGIQEWRLSDAEGARGGLDIVEDVFAQLLVLVDGPARHWAVGFGIRRACLSDAGGEDFLERIHCACPLMGGGRDEQW